MELLVSQIILIASFQGVVLFAYYLIKKEYRQKHLPMLLFIGMYSLELFFEYINFFSEDFKLSDYYYPGYFYGPLIYIYIYRIINNYNQIRKQLAIHFIPVIISFFVYSYIVFFRKELVNDFNLLVFTFLMLEETHFLIYLIFSARLILKYRENAEENTDFNFKWLIALITTLTVLKLIIMIIAVAVLFSEADIIIMFYLVYLSSEGIFLIAASLWLLLNNRKTADEKLRTTVSAEKYSKNKLTEFEIENIYHKLSDQLNNEELFTYSELTINKMSEIINIKTHDISQVVNRKTGSNYFAFINSFRIEKAKKMLTDKNFKDYSILDIAFEVGFSSKSSFNSVFKKSIGRTPTEYRKKENIK